MHGKSVNILKIIISDNLELDENIKIDCNSNEIAVAISTKSGAFNGMIYPKGLSKNSSCMAEFLHERSPVRYHLPLRSCNTMSSELDDGGIEYFNTIVVQPHLKLVTNQGRGFHIRCIYTTKDKTITNNMNVSLMESEPLLATAPMPGCTMKIYYGDPSNREVAENVKIGDPLTLVIAIDAQEVYGLRISDCLVRDGLGWGEQHLIDEDGCPVDEEIMGKFEYSEDRTMASVRFQAHKFPYTDSVYYQCNVKLSVKNGGKNALTGEISNFQPPSCEKGIRRKRQSDNETDEGLPATIEVYSGLYVNEATDGKNDLAEQVRKEKKSDDPDLICISQRNFAIGIAIAGLILILLVVLAIIFLLARRRKRKDTGSSGSSIYSGPYTNTAYSHSS
ncbi:UNVERIFIED_CONTAM: hypothetical protein PYX00_009894 [Menopon gallinae]|uniref:ZP domain-containing protein n=1 Tax=Menopon gallinae TaxID=328185 RepID=A0AAW2HDQ5_9NEOP